MSNSKRDNFDNLTEFIALCKKGDENGCMDMLKVIEPLLKCKKTTFIQYHMGQGRNALEAAIEAGFTDVCMELLKYPTVCRLKRSMCRDEVISRVKSPLKLACSKGMEKVYMEMISHPELCDLNKITAYTNADVKSLYESTPFGYTQLMSGCKYGMTDLCLKILSYPDLHMDTISYVNSRNESAYSLAKKNKMWSVCDKINEQLELKEQERKVKLKEDEKKQHLKEYREAVYKILEQYPEEASNIFAEEATKYMTKMNIQEVHKYDPIRVDSKLPSPAKEVRIPYLSHESYQDIQTYLDMGETDHDTKHDTENQKKMDDAIVEAAVKIAHESAPSNLNNINFPNNLTFINGPKNVKRKCYVTCDDKESDKKHRKA